MKSLILFVVLLQLVSMAFAKFPLKDQPDCLGITFNSKYGWSYATLFEGGGSKYYFTCEHWHPRDGETLTFGNGAKGVVKTTYFIRGGAGVNQFDITVGELVTPVNVTPIPVWWKRPTDAGFVQGQISITGFGALDETHFGSFTGSEGLIYDNYPIEFYRSLFFKTQTVNLIGPGYSGAPIFYQNKLLGINSGAWINSNGDYGGGVVNLVSMEYQEFFPLFPKFLQPQLTINQVGGEAHVVLDDPFGVFKVVSSPSLSEQAVWIPVETNSEYLGSTSVGKVTTFRLNKTSGSMFFKAGIW